VQASLKKLNVDVTDEENYRRETFFQVGQDLATDYVVFVAVTNTAQRTRTNLFTTVPEGEVTIKYWLLDVKNHTPLFSAKQNTAKARPAAWGGVAKGSDQQLTAADRVVKDTFKSFLTAFPEIKGAKGVTPENEKPKAVDPTPPTKNNPEPKPAPTPEPSKPTPAPAPAPAPLPVLQGILDGLEPDASAIEARIKSVSTEVGNLKPWDTIVAIRVSDKEDFVFVDSWSSVHDLLEKKQARGEVAVKIRRGNDTITSKAVAK